MDTAKLVYAAAEHRQLLEVFFQGADMAVNTPALRSIPLAIDRWLKVLHIDFAESITISPLGRLKRGEASPLGRQHCRPTPLSGGHPRNAPGKNRKVPKTKLKTRLTLPFPLMCCWNTMTET